MIPALVWLGLVAISFGLFFNKRGHTHSAGEEIWGTLCIYLLYYWGGVFESFQIADAILILISGINLGHTLANDGEYYEINTSFRVKATLMTIVNAVVLYYAGFFDGLLATI